MLDLNAFCAERPKLAAEIRELHEAWVKADGLLRTEDAAGAGPTRRAGARPRGEENTIA